MDRNLDYNWQVSQEFSRNSKFAVSCMIKIKMEARWAKRYFTADIGIMKLIKSQKLSRLLRLRVNELVTKKIDSFVYHEGKKRGKRDLYVTVAKDTCLIMKIRVEQRAQ